MLDDWNNLKQGSKPVSEYIAKFDKYMSRCDVMENETLTLSRFRSGLREDLKRELILREIYTIQDAFEMVQNYDSLSTQPRHFEPNSRASTFPKPVSSQTNPTRVNPGIGKGKSVFRSNPQCYNCKQYGHVQSQCTNPRSLHIGSEDHQDNNEQKI